MNYTIQPEECYDIKNNLDTTAAPTVYIAITNKPANTIKVIPSRPAINISLKSAVRSVKNLPMPYIARNGVAITINPIMKFKTIMLLVSVIRFID